MSKAYNRSRIDRLTELLQARTDSAGAPMRGYTKNVAAIKAEIATLEEQMENERGN